MILWRPVGLGEMALIFESGMRAFPPRRPEQPIFYPVMNGQYAAQIARDWNTKEPAFAGYVVRFEVADDHAARFEPQTVGSATHRELWVPAEHLAEFNEHVRPGMVAERAFFGSRFSGEIGEQLSLRGKDARAQIAELVAMLARDPAALERELVANARGIFLAFPYWKAAGAPRLGVDPEALDECLARIRTARSVMADTPPLIEDAEMLD